MSPGDVLFHPDTLLALFAYAVSAAILLLITIHLAAHIDDLPAGNWLSRAFSEWYLQHIWIPLIRIASVLVFVLLAYPVLFGLSPDPEKTPSILALLGESERFSTLFNVLFFVTIVLPAIPLIGGLHALILPAQGIAATLLVFNWILPAWAYPPINYWPSWNTVLWLFILAIASHWMALKFSETAGELLDDHFNSKGYMIVIYQMTLLLFQAPIILVYSLFLGNQL